MDTASNSGWFGALRASLDPVIRPLGSVGVEEDLGPLKQAALCVLMWGGGYAVLYLFLALQGHQPSMTRGLPVAAEEYYAAACLYSLPLCLALAFLVGATADLASGDGRGPVYGFRAFAPGYAGPLLWCFVVPDLLVLGLFGFETLAMAMRFTAPVAVVLVMIRTYRMSRGLYSVSRSRAVWMTLLAALAQAAPAALLLR